MTNEQIKTLRNAGFIEEELEKWWKVQTSDDAVKMMARDRREWIRNCKDVGMTIEQINKELYRYLDTSTPKTDYDLLRTAYSGPPIVKGKKQTSTLSKYKRGAIADKRKRAAFGINYPSSTLRYKPVIEKASEYQSPYKRLP